QPIYPLTLVRCRPIGVIQMLDDGRGDEKIIAVPMGDPHYASYESIFDLPQHIYDEMRHFFTVYKALENKETVVDEVLGPEDARRIVQKAIDFYEEKFEGKAKR
ncbi:MAG: inorganic diphosphatase, partial [Oscillospiraceae bacterium]|nr:inorganic diphosphatase [Oscillospiraceae bacterium]